jgi:hypothetical protein
MRIDAILALFRVGFRGCFGWFYVHFSILFLLY